MTPLGKANLLTLTLAPLVFLVVMFAAGTVSLLVAGIFAAAFGSAFGSLLYTGALGISFLLAGAAFIKTVRAIRRSLPPPPAPPSVPPHEHQW